MLYDCMDSRDTVKPVGGSGTQNRQSDGTHRQNIQAWAKKLLRRACTRGLIIT